MITFKIAYVITSLSQFRDWTDEDCWSHVQLKFILAPIGDVVWYPLDIQGELSLLLKHNQCTHNLTGQSSLLSTE